MYTYFRHPKVFRSVLGNQHLSSKISWNSITFHFLWNKKNKITISYFEHNFYTFGGSVVSGLDAILTFLNILFLFFFNPTYKYLSRPLTACIFILIFFKRKGVQWLSMFIAWELLMNNPQQRDGLSPLKSRTSHCCCVAVQTGDAESSHRGKTEACVPGVWRNIQ